MASSFGSYMIIVIVIIATIYAPAGASNQYKVGDAEGWQMPNENNADMYKIWASKITFHVGDSIGEYCWILLAIVSQVSYS